MDGRGAVAAAVTAAMGKETQAEAAMGEATGHRNPHSPGRSRTVRTLTRRLHHHRHYLPRTGSSQRRNIATAGSQEEAVATEAVSEVGAFEVVGVGRAGRAGVEEATAASREEGGILEEVMAKTRNGCMDPRQPIRTCTHTGHISIWRQQGCPY